MFIWLLGGVFQSSLVEWRMLQAVLLRLKLSKFIERHGLPLKSAAVIKKVMFSLKNTFIVLFRVYKDLAIF